MNRADAKRLAYWLFKPINRAIREFSMLANGDRIAVAVSGGKDSLSLLRLLDWRRRFCREDYELVAIHVTADARGPETPLHPPLERWLREQGYDYSLVPITPAANERLPMDCRRCTWHRRQALFEEAERLGCGLLAYGHHADDLAQTTLMNLVYHGRVETMAPVRTYFDDRFLLIRPLCYVDEKDLRRFAAACDFPPPPPLCPRTAESRRELGRSLLAMAQGAHRLARVNLVRAGLRGIGLGADAATPASPGATSGAGD